MSPILSLIDSRSDTQQRANRKQKSLRAITQRRVPIMSIPIADLTCESAIDLITGMIERPLATYSAGPVGICFANAHTLNTAYSDEAFANALRSFDFVFGDGTGIRWAARMRGHRMLDNVNGTDLTPRLLSSAGSRHFSYFLLGADQVTISKAADYARRSFPAWNLVGSHHGFVQSAEASERVVSIINDVEPDVVLVGMGNPIQELWIQKHRSQLHTKVCMAVGGLFDFWSGNVSRAPSWLRGCGHEWIWRLWQQPSAKAKRYLIGNPLYLLRAGLHARGERIQHDLPSIAPPHFSP